MNRIPQITFPIKRYIFDKSIQTTSKQYQSSANARKKNTSAKPADHIEEKPPTPKTAVQKTNPNIKEPQLESTPMQNEKRTKATHRTTHTTTNEGNQAQVKETVRKTAPGKEKKAHTSIKTPPFGQTIHPPIGQPVATQKRTGPPITPPSTGEEIPGE